MTRAKTSLFAFIIVAVLSPPLPAAEQVATESSKGAITAIDVAESLRRGGTYTDAAKRLSERFAFDRDAAIKSGLSDRQIIMKLLTGSRATKETLDRNSMIRHKFDGDKYLNGKQYEKAATEYTSAINSAVDDVSLYKSRGDSYMKYLEKISNPPKVKGDDEPAKNGKGVLCDCIYADYRSSFRANNDVLRDLESKLIVLKADMSNKEMTDLAKGNVAPYHYRAAGNIHGMRELDKLYRQQRTARNNEAELRRAVERYRNLCVAEYAALVGTLRAEKELDRDKKWVNYGQSGGSGYFYDKPSMEKSGDERKVWTLQENLDGRLDDKVSLVRVNCAKMTSAVAESSTYDEFGILIKKELFKQVSSKILPDSTEEMLAREACK